MKSFEEGLGGATTEDDSDDCDQRGGGEEHLQHIYPAARRTGSFPQQVRQIVPLLFHKNWQMDGYIHWISIKETNGAGLKWVLYNVTDPPASPP